MNEKLWDEEHSTYLVFDLTSNRLLEVYVALNFVLLYAGIPDEERARHRLTACSTRDLASRMSPSRRYRATTRTVSPSSRRGTGVDRCGPT